MKILLLPFFALILVSCQKDRRVEYRVFMDLKDSCTAEWIDGFGRHTDWRVHNGFHASYYESPGNPMRFVLTIHKKYSDQWNQNPVVFEARIDGDLIDAFTFKVTDSVPYIYTFRSKIPKK